MNIKQIGCFFLLMSISLLSSCSGVSKVCDKKNICLETWSNVSATSTVTVSQLRTAQDNPVVGSTIMSTSGGIVSYIDPFAQGINTTANEVRAIEGAH